MRVLVVYESMYGNTRAIAEAISEGLAAAATVDIAPVARVHAEKLAGVDLLVTGAPTHGWNLSRPSTRRNAATAARKPGRNLTLEPEAEATGLREWFAQQPGLPRHSAAFDTRFRGPFFLTGRASTKIVSRLVRGGSRVVTPPASFFVTRDNTLYAGELDRARAWGARLADTAGVTAP